MDEDKINPDVSDKRRAEDDTGGPKPNPKRIKLVRPVFSPVPKPAVVSTNETVKPDAPATETPVSGSSSDKPTLPVETARPADKAVDQPEIVRTIVEPLPVTVANRVQEPETADLQSVDSPVTVEAPVAPSVAEPQVAGDTLLVAENQTDNSTDALDIPDIFSEETKKELENLKKNIFKIDDDGSSSENDSQSKRPRLKRPTFVTSTVETKVESNDRSLNTTIETSKSDTVKENSNVIDCVAEKECFVDTYINKVNELVDENKHTTSLLEKKSITVDDVKKDLETDIEIGDSNNELVEEESEVTESINELIEEESNVAESSNGIEEQLIATNSFVNEDSCALGCSTSVGYESKVTKSINEVEEKLTATNKLVNEDSSAIGSNNKVLIKLNKIKKTDDIVQTDTEIEQKTIKTDINELQHNYEDDSEEERANTSSESYESVELDEKNKPTNDQYLEANVLPNKDKLNDAVKMIKSICKDSATVVLERIKDEKDNKNRTTDETTEESSESDDQSIIETDNDCTVIFSNKDKQEVETNAEDKNDLEKPNLNIQTVKEENNSSDVLIEQNLDDKDSQVFKSDILKAALTSKKSPESHPSSPEVHDLDRGISSTPLETIKNEILPTFGKEDIDIKIETEIQLSTEDQPTNYTKPQNNLSISNIPKEALSSNQRNKIHTTSKNNDEPPKWGSAKMNEVEKFLNDSNVSITPIGRSQETPKLGKITLKLPKVGNPEIKIETTVRPDVKSELIKKITNKQNAMNDSPLKSALSQPSKSFNEFAVIQPAPKLSPEEIALLEQQILNTPKKRGRPSKALAQQKQLLLQYQQQQQQHTIPETNDPTNVENADETVFHVPLFDMEDMSGGAGMFDSFEASTPKRAKGVRGKGSRGRRGRGGSGRVCDGSDSDTAPKMNIVDEERETYIEEMIQDEETKQVALIEAERLRKEEARERKLEERKKKLKLRNDILKEKKLKKKKRAEERRLQGHEKKRLMQEEKARAAEMRKSLPPPQNFDDETRMSADCNSSWSQTPARNFMIGDDDLSISGTTNDSMRLKKGRMEVIDLESNKTLTVDQIAEYQWPLEGGELYMIQEQISNFLGVKSFKRKYPGLKRRNVEAEERTFLCDSGLVAESLCDLGLTVLYSSEVLDIMYADFPEKYEELREYMRLKHAKELSNRQRALVTISSNADGSKLDLRDRAMEAVANWNVNFNKSRLESRKCSMDMQTFIVHYPKNKCKKMTIPKPKTGNYPLALLPGQFSDYYATYSSEDLRYLPLNTVMYGPLKSVDKDFPVSLSSQSESEDSSSDDSSSDSDDSINADSKLEKKVLEFGPSDKKGAQCKLCSGTSEKNKVGTVEPLIHCSKCLTIYHPTCIDMTLEMVPFIKRYNWQCNECKSCAQCKEVADEDKMLFCDLCDRGYHIYCVGLRRVPEGRWHCQECAMCSSCGVSDPGPGDSKWFYEFKKVEKTGSKVYCRTLCAPCSRSWKKGHYCPNCMRCYPIKNVELMTQCNGCDRYLHPECINENTPNSQVVTCSICEEKAVSRLLTTVPRSLIKV